MKQKKQMGSYLEPSREVSFDGMTKKKKKFLGGGEADKVISEARQKESDSQSFSQAFAAARKAGKTSFTWRGSSYGTRKKGEDKATHSNNMSNRHYSNEADKKASNDYFARQAANKASNDYYARQADSKAARDSRMTSRSAGPIDSGVKPASERGLQMTRQTVPVSKSKKETRQDNRAAAKNTRQVNRAENKASRSEQKESMSSKKEARQANRQTRRDNKAKAAVRGTLASKERYIKG